MRYSLSAGGKRLRPLLLLEACSVCGGDAEKALPYACAVEFIHTYSLIHDDHPSMDDDDYRRGKLTNHKVFGDGMAILAGDGLLNSAFDVMMEDILPAAGRGEDVSFLLRAAYEISSSAGVRGMIAGQAADLQNTGNGYRQDAKFAGNLQGKRTTVRERCAAAAVSYTHLSQLHKAERRGEDVPGRGGSIRVLCGEIPRRWRRAASSEPTSERVYQSGVYSL